MEPSRISIVLDSNDRTSTGIIEEGRFLLLMTAARRLIQRFSSRRMYPIEVISIRTDDARGYGRSYEIKIVLRRPEQDRDPERVECRFSFCPDNRSANTYCRTGDEFVDKIVARGVKHIKEAVQRASASHTFASERWELIKDKETRS